MLELIDLVVGQLFALPEIRIEEGVHQGGGTGKHIARFKNFQMVLKGLFASNICHVSWIHNVDSALSLLKRLTIYDEKSEIDSSRYYGIETSWYCFKEMNRFQSFNNFHVLQQVKQQSTLWILQFNS